MLNSSDKEISVPMGKVLRTGAEILASPHRNISSINNQHSTINNQNPKMHAYSAYDFQPAEEANEKAILRTANSEKHYIRHAKATTSIKQACKLQPHQASTASFDQICKGPSFLVVAEPHFKLSIVGHGNFESTMMTIIILRYGMARSSTDFMEY